MLEFYSVRLASLSRGTAHRSIIVNLFAPRLRACLLVTAFALLGACATLSPPPTAPGTTPLPPPTTTPLPTIPAPYVEPPPPPVNLQGFPPTYRLGFGDGCATARGTDKRDTVRFGNDGNYRTGWNDGLAQCKKR